MPLRMKAMWILILFCFGTIAGTWIAVNHHNITNKLKKGNCVIFIHQIK